MPIFLWHGLQSGPVTDSFNQIVHEWNIQNPESQVQSKQYADYGKPAIEALEITDSTPVEEQPTFVLAPEFMTSRMMKEGKIIPINEFFEQEQLDNIAEIVKRTFGDKDGKLMSLPFNPACGVLFYNKELVEKALTNMGLKVDQIPQSMQELQMLCQQQGISWGSAWYAAYLGEIVAAQQDYALVEPENGKLGHGAFQLSQDWFYQHILDLRKQIKEGAFFYVSKDPASAEPRKAFLEGRVAFFMQGSGHFAPLTADAKKASQPFTVSCASIPILLSGQTKKYAFPLGGASIWVMDTAKTRQLAKEVRSFLNYLSSEKVQEKWHKETAYVPVLQSLPSKLEKEGFYTENPLHKAVVAQTIQAPLGKHSFGIHLPKYDVARKAIFALLDDVLDLQKTDEEVKELLKKFDEQYSVASGS